MSLEIQLARNPEYEQVFLEQLTKDAHRRYGVDAEPFAAAVRDRLRHGEGKYGEDGFLTTDNLMEVRQEAPDVVGYALLEIQRIQHLGLNAPDGVFHHLYEAALAAAVAYWHARQAQYLIHNRY